MGGSTDSVTPPEPTFVITGRAPNPGRAGVPLSASVLVSFSENIDPATVQQGAVSANGLTYGTLTVEGQSLKFTPVGGWTPGTAYAISLSPAIAGSSGIPLGSTATWGFKTAGDPPVPDTILAARARPR